MEEIRFICACIKRKLDKCHLKRLNLFVHCIRRKLERFGLRVFNPLEVLKYIAATLHSPLSYRIDVMIGR